MATQVLIPNGPIDWADELVALRRQLRPLLPAVADICGLESVQYRLLKRALVVPPADPAAELKALRLARFALDEAPPYAQRALAGWPGEAWRRDWDQDTMAYA